MDRFNKSELEKYSKYQLIDIILEFDDKVNILENRIKELESQVKPPKNSNNSSISPSTDLTRPHKNKKGKGKFGPLFGHKGKCREISKEPDYILDIPLKEDPETGKEIISNSTRYKRHQIIEIEPAKLIVIEIRRQFTTGSNERSIIAPNPSGIKDYQRFGPNLKTQISYMRFVLNIPWNKIIEWLKDITGNKLSSGSLQKIFEELKSELTNEYENIKGTIRTSEVVGGDETGFHVNGNKWWVHCYRTEEETLFKASESRGHKVAQSILGEDFEGTLLTDFWGAYNTKFFPKAKGFQKCVSSHGLRMLTYAQECEIGKGDYARRLTEVILDAVYLKKYFIFETPEYIEEREGIESRLNELLSDKIDTITHEGKKIWKLFNRYRNNLLLFLYNEEVSADNNGSERDIRKIVMCRKASGAYRKKKGIETLCLVKSIISTYKKQNKNIIDMFLDAFGKFVFENQG